ncbi:MAG TPA: hypothetical protein PLS45_10010, partial [Bacillota bacterium]|nr:hypothetical protein [Bacillota bacterium]
GIWAKLALAAVYTIIAFGYFLSFFILSIMPIGYFKQGIISGIVGLFDKMDIMNSDTAMEKAGTMLKKRYQRNIGHIDNGGQPGSADTDIDISRTYTRDIHGNPITYWCYIRNRYNSLINRLYSEYRLSDEEYGRLLLDEDAGFEALDGKHFHSLKSKIARERIRFWLSSLLRPSGIPAPVEWEDIRSIALLPYCSDLPKYACKWSIDSDTEPDKDMLAMGIVDSGESKAGALKHTILYQCASGYADEWLIFVERLSGAGLINDVQKEALLNIGPYDRLDVIEESDLRQQIVDWVNYRIQTLKKTFVEVSAIQDSFAEYAMLLGYDKQTAVRMAQGKVVMRLLLDSVGRKRIAQDPEQYSDLLQLREEGKIIFVYADYWKSIVNWSVGSPKAIALSAVVPNLTEDLLMFFDGDTEIRPEDADKLINASSEFARNPRLGIINFRQYILTRDIVCRPVWLPQR